MTNAVADQRWMSAALALARRGLGRVAPNPAVGCVIVAEGRVVGRGWTQPGGRPHAEAMALAQAGPAARGATVYVTLEPCAHHGQTPPCAEALAAAGIARLVAPLADPDPRTAGKGFERLRAAGVVVEVGLARGQATQINRGFLSRNQHGRPFVTLKLASSLDGRIATASGESRWITGPAARARVHLMRAANDAVLIGAGTARADDPLLDVRLPGLEGRAPIRVVADGGLTLPPDSKLCATAGDQPLWLAARPDAHNDALIRVGAVILPVAADDNGALDLGNLLEQLGARGVNAVLCEGGAALAASLLRAGLVDELVWFSAGLMLGADGVAATAPMGLGALADAARFKLIEVDHAGGDAVSIWRPPVLASPGQS